MYETIKNLTTAIERLSVKLAGKDKLLGLRNRQLKDAESENEAIVAANAEHQTSEQWLTNRVKDLKEERDRYKLASEVFQKERDDARKEPSNKQISKLQTKYYSLRSKIKRQYGEAMLKALDQDDRKYNGIAIKK